MANLFPYNVHMALLKKDFKDLGSGRVRFWRWIWTMNTVPKKYDSNYLRKFYINIHKEWPLSVRTQNCLLNKGIIFIGDLISYSKLELLNMKNFGRKSFNEIKSL